jgi:hypothetical protein
MEAVAWYTWVEILILGTSLMPMPETSISDPAGQRLWSEIPASSAEVEAAGQQLDNLKGGPITRTAWAERAL